MSAVDEVKQLTESIMQAAAKGELLPFVNALDEDLEVFDHLPFRFEDKQVFATYLQSLGIGAESLSYNHHQTSYRAITESTVVLNAYDHLITAPKTGGFPKVQSGRATWVYAKKSKGWKIVSAHFSPLPRD
jgi:ketosteroid isomerase-like protein